MRILWFTNSPSLAAKEIAKTYNVGSSWIESLEKGIVNQSNIELGIAFSWKSTEIEQFQLEGHATKYYKLPSYPIGKWAKYFYRLACLPEPRKAIDDYLKVVEDFKPDIIHFFGTESTFPLMISELKVPSVIWFQGNLTVYHTKWESGFSIWKWFRHEKFWNILNGESILHGYVLDKKHVTREKEIFAHATNFTGRTDWDRRLVSVMAPQAQYFHLEEAMREDFHKKKWQPHKERDKFILVTTIRSNPYKGLETLMEASKLLVPLIDKKFEWRIVGINENDPYVKASQETANYPDFAESVKLLGSRSGPELANELLNADAYIHPSHIDNSPNSVCEAMLMGLPVVATNVGGVPCILKDQEEGLLVQSGDSYALAGAILEVYNNPEKAWEMGRNASIRGIKRNNLDKIIENLLSIYEEIIQTDNSPTNGILKKH